VCGECEICAIYYYGVFVYMCEVYYYVLSVICAECTYSGLCDIFVL